MSTGTQNHIASCSSSHKMENSEMERRAINLGKMLIQELGREPDCNTISRWMAQYIAEQISIFEAADGDAKVIAGQKCYETVLKLWQQRSTLPNGHRPYESFEPIFRALDRLDPESENPFYFPRPNFYGNDASEGESECDAVQQWVDVALGLDQTARILIDYAFNQAANNSADENTKGWITNEVDMQNADDRSIVIRLLPCLEELSEEEKFEKLRTEQIAALKSRIEKLEAFSELSSILHGELLDDLQKISSKKV
ncbi:hypothetical protein [Mariprofundus ferrooxydans]|uniref:hypothetical protein n=1 Tax=Mariprofundus ferrooxydans TaxID=314344 RepID=UPI00039BAAB3|nr:hypothetical protein [Mariprofundus ferrooxydans]